MSKPDVQRVKDALTDAGLEIYRTLVDETQGSEIQIAERIRLHIMDSGVRVRLEDPIEVRFTARSQRSDFPNADAEQLFARVREVVGSEATPRGYAEVGATTVEVKDPVDDEKVLDVWHEVTYRKPTSDLDTVVEEVRWALDVEKYVTG